MSQCVSPCTSRAKGICIMRTGRPNECAFSETLEAEVLENVLNLPDVNTIRFLPEKDDRLSVDDIKILVASKKEFTFSIKDEGVVEISRNKN